MCLSSGKFLYFKSDLKSLISEQVQSNQDNRDKDLEAMTQDMLAGMAIMII